MWGLGNRRGCCERQSIFATTGNRTRAITLSAEMGEEKRSNLSRYHHYLHLGKVCNVAITSNSSHLSRMFVHMSLLLLFGTKVRYFLRFGTHVMFHSKSPLSMPLGATPYNRRKRV